MTILGVKHTCLMTSWQLQQQARWKQVCT